MFERTLGDKGLGVHLEGRTAIFDSLVRATTGMTLDRAGLETLANRITQETRRFNVREGLGAATDILSVPGGCRGEAQ